MHLDSTAQVDSLNCEPASTEISISRCLEAGWDQRLINQRLIFMILFLFFVNNRRTLEKNKKPAKTAYKYMLILEKIPLQP